MQRQVRPQSAENAKTLFIHRSRKCIPSNLEQALPLFEIEQLARKRALAAERAWKARREHVGATEHLQQPETEPTALRAVLGVEAVLQLGVAHDPDHDVFRETKQRVGATQDA